MNLLGLDPAEVSKLVRAVSAAGLPAVKVGDRFARAAWTGVAEPGDRIAGELVDTLGASNAFTTLIEGWSSERIADAAGAAGSDLLVAEIDDGLARWTPRLTSGVAITALRQAARYSVQLLTPDDAAWPVGLFDLGPFAPIALWLRGNESTLFAAQHSIALVGARAATGYGEHITMEASAGLVDRGYAIVSGAAYGIDGMAHRAALASSGQTIAFLAGGVDRFYPSGHDALLNRIVEKGAVISELPCGSPPTKWRFLQRNRLISAVSQATIVLEAGWRSGSLNTAGHASTLGRALGAVPGPVTSAASAGCHRLIRDFSAVLVTTAAEMAELAPLDDQHGETSSDIQQGQPTSTAVRVVDALSTRAPRRIEDVAVRSGLSLAAVQAELGALEVDGTAREGERGWTILAKPKTPIRSAAAVVPRSIARRETARPTA